MKTIYSYDGDLIPGGTVTRRGDVTQLISLIRQNSEELEDRLGYERGRLRLGWCLLVLDESVGINDFTWGGTTENSGGTDGKNTEEFRGQVYRIPVDAVKRYKLLDEAGGDEAAADAAFDRFRANQLRFLNDRETERRIAKVVPTIGHDNSKFWLTQYPDAAASKGIKQWTLSVAKRFRVAAKVPAGQMYLGGGTI